MDSVVLLNRPRKPPQDEKKIIISTDCDGEHEFTSGWYDLNEGEYYQHDGEVIDFGVVIGWALRPDVELK